MCQLQKLETLNLDNNNLSSLPKNINQCKALKTISLRNNKLKTIPDQLSDLKHLNSVDLSHNSITTIPESIGKMQVVELNLNQNQVICLERIKSYCICNTWSNCSYVVASLEKAFRGIFLCVIAVFLVKHAQPEMQETSKQV